MWRLDDDEAGVAAEKLVRSPLWSSIPEVTAAWTDGDSRVGEKRSDSGYFGGQASCPWE